MLWYPIVRRLRFSVLLYDFPGLSQVFFVLSFHFWIMSKEVFLSNTSDGPTLAEVIEDIRARYEGLLSYRKMATDAGLVENLVYKAVKHGSTPRPASLKALAERWGRTPEEQASDFQHLMRAAGYVVAPPPAYGEASHFEQLLAKIMGMTQAAREAWAADQLVALSLVDDADEAEWDDDGFE
jgi:DNA-binding phage protein